MLLHMCMCSITLSGGQLVHDSEREREKERERDREWGARRGTRMKESGTMCVHVRVRERVSVCVRE